METGIVLPMLTAAQTVLSKKLHNLFFIVISPKNRKIISEDCIVL